MKEPLACFMLMGCYAMLREEMVKIAIPLFNSRVSPRFDFAGRLLCVTIADGKIIERQEFSLINFDTIKRISLLCELKVDVMLCGGISSFAQRFIQSRGIEVIPLVQGEVEKVLDLFINGNLSAAIIPVIPGKKFRHHRRMQRWEMGGRKLFDSKQK
jgi:predicted Fe-Mo cluster-binding NifX family protein